MTQLEKAAIVKEVTDTWARVVQAKLDAIQFERKALPESMYWEGQADCIQGVQDALIELNDRQSSQPIT